MLHSLPCVVVVVVCALADNTVATSQAGAWIMDGHNDLPLQYRRFGYDLDRLDIRLDQNGTTQTDIGRLRAGNVGAQFWSVYIGCNYQDKNAVTATLEQIDVVYQMARRYPGVFAMATTADEVEAIVASGRIASLMGIEGGHQIDTSLGTLRMMHQLGVRYMTLTHNCNTPWSDAQSEPDENGGLNEYGAELILEMNRLGMMVDVSHTAHRTMRRALEVSVAPIIFSHTCVYAKVAIERNAPDDVLEQLAKNRGVAMVTFVGSFLVNSGNAYATDVADHIEHIIEVAGIDHVGIGGDYDGTSNLPVDMRDVSTYPILMAELSRRGYTQAELELIAHGNILRVMREVEAVARELSNQNESPKYLPYTNECRNPISSNERAIEYAENTDVHPGL